MNFNQRFDSREKSILWGGSMIMIASGIPWWITDYATYTSSHIYSDVSMGLCVLGAFILSLFTDLKYRAKVLVALVSHMFAFLFKVFIDCLEDKTNHNLFPFEIAYYLVIEGPAVLVLVAIGSFIRKKIRRPTNNPLQH